MAIASFDSSAVVRCPKHGKRFAGVFVRPDEHGGGFPAFYTCLHCLNETPMKDAQHITREQALSLPRLK